MDKNLFLFIANIFQVFVSLLIAMFLHGRRMYVIYIILALTASTEIFSTFYELLRTSPAPTNTSNQLTDPG